MATARASHARIASMMERQEKTPTLTPKIVHIILYSSLRKNRFLTNSAKKNHLIMSGRGLSIMSGCGFFINK